MRRNPNDWNPIMDHMIIAGVCALQGLLILGIAIYDVYDRNRD